LCLDPAPSDLRTTCTTLPFTYPPLRLALSLRSPSLSSSLSISQHARR
jgi:hypothetical protein